jgi:hypothetical protein
MTDIDEPITTPQDTSAPTFGAASPTAPLVETTNDVPPASTQGELNKPIMRLTAYLTEQLPVGMRAVSYAAIVQAIKKGQVKGFIHPVDKHAMTVTDYRGKVTERAYPEVLLKNSERLISQLDALCLAAAHAEVIRTGGRTMSVEELMMMGDDFDFDVLITKVQKKYAARSKQSAAQANKSKGKASTRAT